MRVDWIPLKAELRLWRSEGLELPVWWRDDDAADVSGSLERLSELSETLAMPVHLAVVPVDATEALADFVREYANLVPVVHGWAHVNNEPTSAKKAEFGSARSLEECADDAGRGLSRLGALFAGRLAPMFVPPWNRINPALLPHLAGQGFDAVSTFTPRLAPEAAPGLTQINTHVDPIHWRGSRGLVEPDELVRQIVDLLQDRRKGRADNGEPFGYLTHHLVHDEDIWEFSRQYLLELRDGPIRPYRHDGRETA